MENGSSNGGIGAAIRAPTISENQQLLPTSPRSQLNGYDLGSHYTSSFFPAADSLPNSSYISLCQSPSSCEDEAPNSTENRLYLARLMLQNQQLAERYSLCLSHLRETVQEAEALRQENADLRNTIGDMTKRMGLLSLSGKQNPQKSRVGSSGYQLQSVMDNLQRSCVGDAGKNGLVTGEGSEASPTSVLGFEENRFQRAAGPERVALPKSISVRSSGFLKVNQAAAADNGASSTRAGRPRERSPVTVPSQRVYVPGGKAGDGCLEMEVYNQGMFKTELCNKWQETGTCPYGDHCQFAHGIEELRPVIRHPRYKTEVCRMVLSGDKCPYGHRCHFRHALTEQEKGLDSA